MSSSRPAATPTTSSFHTTDAFSSSTPPRPTAFIANEYSSPSPRTRLGSRDLANPNAGRSYGYYYHDALNGTSPAGPAAFSPAHEGHPSAPAANLAAYAPFSHHAPNPPRTSSLLPPANISVDPSAAYTHTLLRDPFLDPRPAPRVPDSQKEVEPTHKRGHSRSSSAGFSDSLRNLNRWSASTASSRASSLAAFTRRVSTELLGAALGSPGKKLQRSRPSTSGGSPRPPTQSRTHSESPAPSTVPPLQSLPLISTGPSLQEEVIESNVLGHGVQTEQRELAQQPSRDTTLFWDGAIQGAQLELGSSSSQPRLSESPRPAETVATYSTMPSARNDSTAGHSRSRSIEPNGGADTTTASKHRDRDRDRERGHDRPGKPPSQKAMLSKALQKANTAVQLDNAQNFEGARRAYAEACAVLQQVLLRTSGEEDRRKLEAIHETYLRRVMELDEQLIDLEPEGKELPQRPESHELQDGVSGEAMDQEYSPRYTGARETIQAGDYDTRHPALAAQASGPSRSPVPRGSRNTSRDLREGSTSYLTEQYSLQSAFSRARYNNGSTLRPPMDDAYMPPPLSPRRLVSPTHPPPPPPQTERPEMTTRTNLPMSDARLTPGMPSSTHQRANSHESVSWLDPIDESGGSSASSVHSRSSSRIRRKHIRAPSGATEAEFDAALDDAIEAAYDDGYEPEAQYVGPLYQDGHGSGMTDTLRRVELARERVRESEREVLELALEREKRLRLQQQLEDEEYRRQEAIGEDFYDGNDSEEEERLLEEMTKGHAIEDFAFGGQQRRAPVPRESDSSGTTSRTWHSSTGSNPTATTLLTPVSEDNIPPCPSGPLPALPIHAAAQLPAQPQSAGSQSSNQSVRSRRLSGQNPKQLKIETTKLTATAPPATAGSTALSQPKAGGSYIVQQRQALSAGPNRTVGPFSSRPAPSPAPVDEDEPATAPVALGHDEQTRAGTPSVARPSLKKNFSSSSLKSLRTRNPSISHLDESSELSPGTPLSNHFGIGGPSARLPAVPSLPTPLPTAKERANSTVTGGPHLFESQFHSPNSPGLPNPQVPDAPVALEPCPNDVMLRPFWLMRCLYQTLCHPRGGYLSNKLFVPRDVWRVKGVKLKNVEDKIANCDLLTAALQKLAMVDTCDADLVLEEMQSLEGVLEQVQAALSRKLGSEVGVQGSSTMFKDANGVDGEAAAMPRSASVAGKAGGFSWRRLRSKNSSANLPGLASSYGGKGGSGASSANLHEGSGKDTMLASLPMTSHPTSRPPKRDVGSVLFTGPNANYMASLAKLFDAAQSIDQIARQVDDPGLRHADKTQVGLELCTRHAAEFFAFYICRFALSDLSLLLDKFIKRGSEWVLA
ncbi:hypothetical protein N656DRAFT_736576 [Canariomyces notabilis]|uniref:MIT domain-containing protein n=1 Tax=Canariomyces notabilis TaxID=2074819 RepID=A0AAN6TAC1_9PEZI|nr:hypothetical protein N656DRAFT_736576 [Canariomyces arenarius]